MVTALPVSGSGPNSRSGGLAAPRPRPRPYFGWANSSLAFSRSTVKISSSLPSERVSDLPSAPVLVRYGPYRPLFAAMTACETSPVSAFVSSTVPTSRGRLSSFSASSRVRVSGVMVLNNDAILGLGAAAALLRVPRLAGFASEDSSAAGAAGSGGTNAT